MVPRRQYLGPGMARLARLGQDQGCRMKNYWRAHPDQPNAGSSTTTPTEDRTQAAPITLPISKSIVRAVRENPKKFGGKRDSLAIRNAWCVMWGVWLCPGELLFSKFDRKRTPSRSDFDLASGILHLPWSKTTRGRGADIPLPSGVNHDVNPVQLLRDFSSRYPSANSANKPLISLSNGTLKQMVVEQHLDVALKMICISNNVRGEGTRRVGNRSSSGHSFRRGAATWAASTGADVAAIRTAGIWSGMAWKLYVTAPILDQQRF
ncbi:hypothetical protein M231_02981 [Tremella mesenterica]|uniref:Tyr recombinase domain-containing protein n=1 Tax=Tremella mesenterica TaxID=5217 RepID=A0A4Q1BPF9_TREME|nr:hypothetical protein M231_02981 [Tremella mesenterica]